MRCLFNKTQENYIIRDNKVRASAKAKKALLPRFDHGAQIGVKRGLGKPSSMLNM